MRAVLAAFLSLTTTPHVLAATYVVRSTADAGLETLREAIHAANSAPPGPHTIVFSIPGPGVHTIVPLTPLPEVVVPVQIEGYTQPGARPNQLAAGSDAVILVELDGSNLGGDATGLTFRGGGSTVRGLALVGFPTAIRFRNEDGNRVEGCFIGLGADGDATQPNDDGIATLGGSSANTVGGPAPEQRNVISNNAVRGIVLDTSNNVVQGNLIGLDPSGTLARPNGGGFFLLCSGAIACDGNLIGGGGPGEGNVISGNTDGVVLSGSLAQQTPSGNEIVGNLVGLDAAGLAAVPNQLYGVAIGACDDTLIEGNTVTGGSLGIVVQLGSRRTEIVGNRVGTDLAGAPLLGPHGVGIQVASGALDTLIGGPAAGQANLIAPGAGTGIRVQDDTVQRATILGNSIWGHGGLAVDLVGGPAVTGPDANDPLDADDGPNGVQNHPEVLEVRRNGATWEVDLELMSAPSTSYRVELFGNQACNASGFGEAEMPLTSFELATDASGRATTTVTVLRPAAAAVVTASATDPLGNSSELSPCARETVVAIPALGPLGLTILAGLIALLGLRRVRG